MASEAPILAGPRNAWKATGHRSTSYAEQSQFPDGTLRQTKPIPLPGGW